jgi:hypothetical protein
VRFRAAIPARQRPAQLVGAFDVDGLGSNDGAPVDEAEVPLGEHHRIVDGHDQVVPEAGVEAADLAGVVLDEQPETAAAALAGEVEAHDGSPFRKQVMAQEGLAP